MRVSTLNVEGPYRVSKFLTIGLLVEVEEMAVLTAGFRFFRGSGIVKKGQGEIFRGDFMDAYSIYIESLKSSSQPDPLLLRHHFHDMLSVDEEAVYAIDVGKEEQVIKPCSPLIQMQAHTLVYSSDEKKIRSMILGTDVISWGVQFSYPQLFQDPVSHEIGKVNECANSAPFKAMQRYVRHHTIPVSFIVEGDCKIQTSFRISKSCLDWIDSHPDLVRKGMGVDNAASR